MDWWKHLDPFASLANAAVKVATDGLTVASIMTWNAGLWLLKHVLILEDAFLTPDLSPSGPMASIYPYTFWVAGALVVVFAAAQLGVAGLRRDGASLGRLLLGTGQFVIAWAAWVGYAAAVLAAAGGITTALTRALLGVDSFGSFTPFAPLEATDLSDGVLGLVLAVLGLVLIFSAIAHMLILLARAGALMVLAATGPICAAGLVWEGGRAWFWKAFRWFHAAAFTPVIMVLILGVGVKTTSAVASTTGEGLESAIGSAIPGVFLILIGSFAPLALFKLLAFVDPGTSSGSAMRAGLAAQGGISGLLRSRPDEATSAAASATTGSGASQGEDTSEAATTARAGAALAGSSSRFGPLGQAVGAGLAGATRVVGWASSAAVMGADLTNQMGAGHNTYLPDTPSGPARRTGGGSGPSAGDVPDINGSAPTPTPPSPSTPGPTPAPAAGGGAGPATGTAAAAAVPPVPPVPV